MAAKEIDRMVFPRPTGFTTGMNGNEEGYTAHVGDAIIARENAIFDAFPQKEILWVRRSCSGDRNPAWLLPESKIADS